MLPLDAARTAIRRELRGALATLDGLEPSGWLTATRCEGWAVADLVAHLVWGQRLEASGLAGAAEGREAPDVPDAVPVGEPSWLVDELRAAVEELETRLEALADDELDRLAPMPFGLAPVGLLLQVIAMEVAVHASDLHDALGAPAGLDDDVVAATAVILAAFLPALAGNGTRPDGPVAYRLRGRLVDVRLAFDGAAWSTPENGLVDVTFRGSDSDLCLFALGRGTAGERDLSVDGDVTAAARFRAHVPGI